MHAPADAEQFQPRPGDLRAFPGKRHDPDRGAILSARLSLRSRSIPLFVDLAIRRWQAFTGEPAKRESDGADFEALDRASQPTEPAS